MKKKIGRRGFLGFMAAAPMAAKGVAQETAESLVNYNVGSLSSRSVMEADTIGITSKNPHIQPTKSQIMNFLGGKVPEWKRDEWRREARYERNMPVDIASLKSVSLSSKLRIREERVVQTYEDGWLSQFEKEPGAEIRKTLQEKFGVWL